MRETEIETREFVYLQDGIAFVQLKIDDYEVVDWIRRLSDPNDRIDAVKRALKVGVVAMGSAFVGGTSEAINQAIKRWRLEVEEAMKDAVQQSRDQIVKQITEQFGRQVTEPVTNQIDQITRNVVERIKERVDDLERRIDPNRTDSWLNAVQETIETLKEEFDPTYEGSYLWRIRNTLAEFYGRDGEAAKCISETITQTFKPIQEALDYIRQSVDEVKVRLGGTALQRGLAFEEESVSSLLKQIASVTGDRIEHVGRDGRAGDWLIQVYYGGVINRQCVGSIVIEARDRGLNKREASTDLENALKNRNANVGILIFARPDQNPYGIPLVVLDENYTKLVCVWDDEGLNLNFAYQLARLRILENHLRASAEIDWASLRKQVQDIINEVNRMDELANKARLAKDRAEEAEEMSREIKRNLIRKLQALEQAMGRAIQ